METPTKASTTHSSSSSLGSDLAPLESAETPSTIRPKVLGWLSLALGATALATPTATARLIGAPMTKQSRLLLRGVGAREIGVGLGLLSGNGSSAGMTWLRVLGDAMDLSLLFGAMTSRRAKRDRLLGAVGTIAAIGFVDLAAAIMQTREERAASAA